MSTIRNLSGAPESPLVTGRKLRPSTTESPRGSRRTSLTNLALARSFTKQHGSFEDSEDEDAPPPSRLTFDDDVPLFPASDASGDGESKAQEIRDYLREMERDEREMEQREASRPVPDASREGRDRDRRVEREFDETEGIGLPFGRDSDGTESVVSGGSSLTRKRTNPRTVRRAVVSFSESATERDGGGRSSFSSRPIYCSKMRSATHWEGTNGNDDEGGGGGPPGASPATPRSSTASGPHRPQSPPPSLLAMLNPFEDLSWSLVGNCIVRTAPCCWCAKRKLGASPTDRDILLRLNLLSAFFCAIQIAIGVCLFVVKMAHYSTEEDVKQLMSNPDEDKPLISLDLWSLDFFVFFLSISNLLLLVASVLAQRAIKDVNLVGSVRFMWVLFWLLPLQIFCMVGLFDTHKVNIVNTKHWWDDPLFKSIRELFCESGTADGKCMVPIVGGSIYNNETAWCMAEYNGDTDCTAIRNDAQMKFNVTSTVLFAANGIWALVLLVLMWVILNLLQAIITVPIVQRSKEGNVPLWLTIPIVGCYAAAYLLVETKTSIEDQFRDIYWIGVVLFVDGGCFTLAAGLGLILKFYTVLNGRQRRIKQGIVLVFLGTIMVTIFGVATIFVASLIYSLQIVDLSSNQNLREIACSLDMHGSCTGCDAENPFVIICPEWTDKDVQSVLETIMKQVASIAAIFIVYAMITLRYGFVLLNHVSRYQIEYV